MYFIINNREGDTYVEQVTKKELVERIQPEEGEECCYYGNVGFLDEIDNSDTNYWDDNILIIKGEIVVPAPKKIVKTYDVK